MLTAIVGFSVLLNTVVETSQLKLRDDVHRVIDDISTALITLTNTPHSQLNDRDQYGFPFKLQHMECLPSTFILEVNKPNDQAQPVSQSQLIGSSSAKQQLVPPAQRNLRRAFSSISSVQNIVHEKLDDEKPPSQVQLGPSAISIDAVRDDVQGFRNFMGLRPVLTRSKTAMPVTYHNRYSVKDGEKYATKNLDLRSKAQNTTLLPLPEQVYAELCPIGICISTNMGITCRIDRLNFILSLANCPFKATIDNVAVFGKSTPEVQESMTTVSPSMLSNTLPTHELQSSPKKENSNQVTIQCSSIHASLGKTKACKEAIIDTQIYKPIFQFMRSFDKNGNAMCEEHRHSMVSIASCSVVLSRLSRCYQLVDVVDSASRCLAAANPIPVSFFDFVQQHLTMNKPNDTTILINTPQNSACMTLSSGQQTLEPNEQQYDSKQVYEYSNFGERAGIGMKTFPSMKSTGFDKMQKQSQMQETCIDHMPEMQHSRSKMRTTLTFLVTDVSLNIKSDVSIGFSLRSVMGTLSSNSRDGKFWELTIKFGSQLLRLINSCSLPARESNGSGSSTSEVIADLGADNISPTVQLPEIILTASLRRHKRQQEVSNTLDSGAKMKVACNVFIKRATIEVPLVHQYKQTQSKVDHLHADLQTIVAKLLQTWNTIAKQQCRVQRQDCKRKPMCIRERNERSTRFNSHDRLKVRPLQKDIELAVTGEGVVVSVYSRTTFFMIDSRRIISKINTKVSVVLDNKMKSF